MRLHGVEREKELLSDLPLGQVGRKQARTANSARLGSSSSGSPLAAARRVPPRAGRPARGGDPRRRTSRGSPGSGRALRRPPRVGHARAALRRGRAARAACSTVGSVERRKLLAAACLALDPAVVVLPEQRGRERGVREARRPRPSEAGARCELERTLSACLREVWTAGVRVEQRQRRKGEHDAVGAVSRLWAGNGLVCAIA